MNLNKSQRFVRALLELQQFKLCSSRSDDFAFHVLSGATITAATDTQGDLGLLSLKFPGGIDFDVEGMPYLKLQIAESAAHEIHLDVGSTNPIATRAKKLLESFISTYEL